MAARKIAARLGRRIPRVRFESQLSKPDWFEHVDNPALTFHLLRTITLVLAGIGLLMVFSSSTIKHISKGHNPYLAFARPLLYSLLGIALMLIVSKIGYRVILRLAPTLGILGLTLQIVAAFSSLGHTVNGNTNWIHLGGISIQPSELLKLFLVLWIARVIGQGMCDVTRAKSLLVHVGIPALLVMAAVLAGQDMGTALIFASIVAVMALVANVPRRFLVGGAAVAVFAAAALVAVSASRRRRIAALFQPGRADPQGHDLQTIHSEYALGSGGLVGVGPGASREKWNYLPEAHTDFIFAILGEEFGLVGTITVLILYCILAVGIYRLATHHPDPVVKLIAAGCLSWLVVQAVLNIMVVTGVAPVIGVPLPFISMGGSATVSSFAAMGVLLSCARSEPGADKLLRGRRLRFFGRAKAAPGVVAAKGKHNG